MPASSNMDPKLSKQGSGITIKKEPSSPTSSSSVASKDLKASFATSRSGSSSRLPSFKGPRDLTLSALASSSSSIQPQIARTKKTFVPNIPIRREKGEKVVESKSEKLTKKNFSKSKPGDHGRGRARGKEKEFVQMRGSLFGEGIAAAPLKRSTDSSYGGYNGTKSGGGSKIGEMQKPVLNPEAAYNIDKDLEEKKLKEILRDDFIDDPEEVTTIDALPIQLPMIARNEASFKEESSDSKWKKESLDTQQGPQLGIKIKEEPGIEEEQKYSKNRVNGLLRQGPALGHTQDLLEDSVAQILSNPHSDVMFFQLPSCLPGHPPEVKQESPSGSGNSSRDQNQSAKDSDVATGSQTSKTASCTMDFLPEGQIGSLKVYESGKVKLCLGNHNLEIKKGTEVGFLQDLVRLEVDSELKTGSMVVLGHIEERFVCIPDFESLIRNLTKS